MSESESTSEPEERKQSSSDESPYEEDSTSDEIVYITQEMQQVCVHGLTNDEGITVSCCTGRSTLYDFFNIVCDNFLDNGCEYICDFERTYRSNRRKTNGCLSLCVDPIVMSFYEIYTYHDSYEIEIAMSPSYEYLYITSPLIYMHYQRSVFMMSDSIKCINKK